MSQKKPINEFKQEMPPPSGYRNFNFHRTFPKIIWKPMTVVAIGVGVGFYGYFQGWQFKKHRRNLKFVDTDTWNALEPVLLAERDRNWLKLLRNLRDEEEKIMKDVPGWVVGTWYGEPVYLTLGDKWWDPEPPETTCHMSNSFFFGDGFMRDVGWRHQDSYAGEHWWDKYFPKWLNDMFY
ncbi:hypothetical protein WR25_14601 isoform B [Diploscapter pachys]|uniref:NADH dehydrogenase [ubiquinone] 1 alpha subcomplex subunit 13 n=1 Tax=Diploscapter pachys TaxID=2018661 RepID=A0A2A2LW67_9BILA|nr:hypothetical protein WR25_14601 isoform A [Diploscapter pachys]PAV90452.1 hypothetical protein WR25_14601 isoform B [Diploscapter pachys]